MIRLSRAALLLAATFIPPISWAVTPVSEPYDTAISEPMAAEPDAAIGYPVKTEGLSPGALAPRKINAPGLPAIFLLGDDEHSRLWLQKRGDLLRQLRAVGLAVNVASGEHLEAIRSWGAGLEISPASAQDLAARLGLKHYPVLITATTIEQ